MPSKLHQYCCRRCRQHRTLCPVRCEEHFEIHLLSLLYLPFCLQVRISLSFLTLRGLGQRGGTLYVILLKFLAPSGPLRCAESVVQLIAGNTWAEHFTWLSKLLALQHPKLWKTSTGCRRKCLPPRHQPRSASTAATSCPRRRSQCPSRRPKPRPQPRRVQQGTTAVWVGPLV